MSVHIYKDNLRQSLFRTLLFTDMVIFILIGSIIAGIIFLLFKLLLGKFSLYPYLFVLTLFESIGFIIATTRKDNQPMYKIFSRGIYFSLKEKKLRGSQLDSYYNDIEIQDKFILKKNRINKIFSIKPHDISALNSNERNSFFANLQQVLHILPQRLQVIVRKEVSVPSDFTDHLMNVYKSLPKGNIQKEQMVGNYERDLLEFVKSHSLLTVKQYGVFALDVNTKNPTEKVNGIGRLNDMFIRLASAFENCQIQIKELSNEEITSFLRRLLR